MGTLAQLEAKEKNYINSLRTFKSYWEREIEINEAIYSRLSWDQPIYGEAPNSFPELGYYGKYIEENLQILRLNYLIRSKKAKLYFRYSEFDDLRSFRDENKNEKLVWNVLLLLTNIHKNKMNKKIFKTLFYYFKTLISKSS